ncbi:hypothetical protein [Bradyrhizobium sp. SZCCHNS2002]|uniref:hypothetical protein n=1 Tax=Bradyrhizobium sp. SZCCHNS2002 TaxID=3057302 RepID=UPI002916DAD4|nr:hypothetical protein [Bradyrhizobium sp. SZCCHNS2002]
MTEPKADVALLTPVPEEHLQSGLETCTIEGFVAFGTDASMVLSELKYLVDQEHPADILFYASHTSQEGVRYATYRARFVDFDGAVGGRAKAAWAKYRPATTATDGDFTGFYLVRDFRLLASPIPISSLQKRGNKGKFKSSFHPEGPIIIDTPF